MNIIRQKEIKNTGRIIIRYDFKKSKARKYKEETVEETESHVDCVILN